MSGRAFHPPPPATPAQVRTALVRLAVARGRVGEAMAGAVSSGGASRELEGLAYEMLAGPDGEVRRVGAAALGSLARIHGDIDKDRALGVLRGLMLDPVAGEAAREAIGEIIANLP